MKLIITCTIFLCAFAASTLDAATLHDTQIETLNGRVIGGQNAVPHSAPYIVTIQDGPTVATHQCGGSIISPSWVVTAAHCVDRASPTGPFFMLAGRHNFAIAELGSEQRRDVNRARVWYHHLYPVNPLTHDIAMIHASPAFTFNAFVSPIALPAPGHIHSGVATVFGWGIYSLTGPIFLPSILQTAEYPIIPVAQCFVIFGTLFHETNLCAGALAGGVGSCTADSGGPLVQAGQLVGIVSWGPWPCATPNNPGVYVRVSAFNDWIASIMVL